MIHIFVLNVFEDSLALSATICRHKSLIVARPVGHYDVLKVVKVTIVLDSLGLPMSFKNAHLFIPNPSLPSPIIAMMNIIPENQKEPHVTAKAQKGAAIHAMTNTPGRAASALTTKTA
jgi:hypothetical protein